jgi:hypothetical protein
VIFCDAGDESSTVEIKEQEFLKEFNEAMERINKVKIV